MENGVMLKAILILCAFIAVRSGLWAQVASAPRTSADPLMAQRFPPPGKRLPSPVQPLPPVVLPLPPLALPLPSAALPDVLVETPVYVYAMDESGFMLNASISVLETNLLVLSDGNGLCTCIAPAGCARLTLMIYSCGYAPVRRTVDLSSRPVQPMYVGMTRLKEPNTVPGVRIIPCSH